MKRQRINLAIKVVAGAIIVFVISISIAAYLWHNFKELDYFKIKDIIASENNTADLSYLKGQYIFSINLEKQAYYLSQLYPTYSKIRLVRILPNRIYVDFVRRKAVAYIKLYKYFCVDTDAVLFDVPVQQEMQDLPVVVGLETKIFGPKPGKEFKVKELDAALTIIREIHDNRYLKFCRIKKIDVTYPVNTSAYLEFPFKGISAAGASVTGEGVEIRIGQSDIRERINILGTLFIQLKKEWFNIKYIDLRFKEPVVKFKDKKDVKK